MGVGVGVVGWSILYDCREQHCIMDTDCYIISPM